MVRYPCIIANFYIETDKNCEILGDFPQLDPDPDPADQSRCGSGSTTLIKTGYKNDNGDLLRLQNSLNLLLDLDLDSK